MSNERKTLPRTVQIPDKLSASPSAKKRESAVVAIPAAPSETGRVVAVIPSVAVSGSEVEGVEAVSEPADSVRRTRAMGSLTRAKATPSAGAPVHEPKGGSLALDSYAMSLVKTSFHDEEILTPVAAAHAPDGVTEIPKRIGAYEIERRIGTGGMADVFLARRIGPAGFEKYVVLKCIHAHLAKEQAFVDMFLDEARLAARINDPRVVQTHELGEDNGRIFMAMEYIVGETVSTIIKTGINGGKAMAPRLVARAIADAAAGLHAAHELRDNNGQSLEVVHRDVSPSNIVVLYSGMVKVLDFGVAKARDRLQHTRVGERKGKWGYMSPEQINGIKLDRRADVFSLGVVLWEALASRRLFGGADEVETAHRVLDGVAPPPSSLVAGLPAQLDEIVMRAIAKERTRRYQTCGELAAALETFLKTSGGATASEVASYMRDAFPERLEQRKRLTEDLEPQPADVQMQLTKLDLPAKRSTSQPKTTPRWVWIAGGALVLAIVAAFMLGRRESGQSPAPAPVAMAAPLPSAAPPAEATGPTAESLFDRAMIALDNNRIASPPGENALELILDAERLDPTNPRGAELRKDAVARLESEAEALWKAGKHVSAASIYRDILMFAPKHPVALERTKATPAPPETAVNTDEMKWLLAQIDLAIIERRLVAPPGRNALEYLEALRKLDPKNVATLRLGGEVATALRKEAAAEPVHARELLLAADTAAGTTAATQNPTPEAARDTTLASSHVAMGTKQLALGKLEDARHEFERAVAADSQSHAALAGLGEVAYNQSDFTRAVLYAKRAVRASPNAEAYRMLLAKSYYKLFRYSDAIEQWQAALRLDKSNVAAAKNIEMARRRMAGQ